MIKALVLSQFPMQKGQSFFGEVYLNLYKIIKALVLTQFTMHKGLSISGEAWPKAVFEELEQLHKRIAIHPCEAYKLSTEEKENTLEYLMFLKQKWGGKSKTEAVQMEGSRGTTD